MGANDFVVVQENLLSLKFNFCLGTMYVEQELFHEIGELCETILIQKSRVDSDSFWSLSAGSYKVIGLSKLDMDASTMLLTNESITPTPQIHSLHKVRLEVDDVVVLSDSDEDNIQVLDIAGTSSYPFQSPYSFTSTSFVQPLHGNDPSPHKPLNFSILEQHIHSQKPHVHPTSSISNVHILEALKITKCRRRSKFDLTNIDFDNIVIEDVKYLPSSFNGDVLFILPPIKTKIPDAYGKAMDGWTRFMMGMFGVEPKQQTFRMNLVRLSGGLHALVISNALTTRVSILHEMEEFATLPNGSVLHPLLSWSVQLYQRNLRFNARFAMACEGWYKPYTGGGVCIGRCKVSTATERCNVTTSPIENNDKPSHPSLTFPYSFKPRCAPKHTVFQDNLTEYGNTINRAHE